MLKIIDGDLFKGECDVFIHQANCKKIMGAGIAKVIAKRYPEAKKADKELNLSAKERYGKYSLAYSKKEGKYIVNLYSQYFWGKARNKKEQEERYEKMKSALDLFFEELIKIEQTIDKKLKVGVPYKMGCDLAGGDWERVSKILNDISVKFERDIIAYKLK